MKRTEDIKAEKIRTLSPPTKFWGALEEKGYWKELKKEDKFLKKLNKAIDKKYWKDFQELVGGRENKKSDWL